MFSKRDVVEYKSNFTKSLWLGVGYLGADTFLQLVKIKIIVSNIRIGSIFFLPCRLGIIFSTIFDSLFIFALNKNIIFLLRLYFIYKKQYLNMIAIHAMPKHSDARSSEERFGLLDNKSPITAKTSIIFCGVFSNRVCEENSVNT